MTQTVRQSQRCLFPEDKFASGLELKTVRILYALSVLQFITSNMPFYVPLTEAILCHGGTQKLVTFLNRVGAVSSIETVNRIAVKVVENRMKKGIKAQLVEGKVTIDNVDVLQPYAFVCTLDDTRSWHGASVQCVQPLPKSGNLTESDIHPQGELHTSIAPPPVPPAHVFNSPIPILKKKRHSVL